MTDLSDRQRERFESIFRAHYGAVYRYARRRADPDLADEILAEVFEAAWQGIDRLPASAPLPWLYRVAGNRLAEHRRVAGRNAAKAARAAAERPLPHGRDPADRLAESDAVLAAFSRLGERDREVLRLVAWEGMSQRDAAATLQVSRPAFAMRLQRAKRRLAVHLADLENSEAYIQSFAKESHA
jgi:RNA polymerase sigma-70 factor (ECF subfamily)